MSIKWSAVALTSSLATGGIRVLMSTTFSPDASAVDQRLDKTITVYANNIVTVFDLNVVCPFLIWDPKQVRPQHSASGADERPVYIRHSASKHLDASKPFLFLFPSRIEILSRTFAEYELASALSASFQTTAKFMQFTLSHTALAASLHPC
ncbi:MAG TPA: hypothetical protein VNG71_11175 [Pyrinomonadaceae bacterium]|nr:hypothetical protein [Pyrinomonadaceae bacterium]